VQRGLLSRRYVAVYVAVVFVENEAWVLDSDSDYRAPDCPIQKPSGSGFRVSPTQSGPSQSGSHFESDFSVAAALV